MLLYVKNKNRKTVFTSLISALAIGMLVSGWFNVRPVFGQSASNNSIQQISLSASLFNSENRIILNGTYEVRFGIYNKDRAEADSYPSNADTGSRLWEETQTVTVKNGIFRVFLGAITPFSETLNFESGEYYIGMRIGTDSEMTPRKKLGSVPSAVNAQFLQGKTIGTQSGNIPLLGNNGKIDIRNLPTGTGTKQLVLGNDARLKKAKKITLSGNYDYLTLSGQNITLEQIDLLTDTTGLLPVANGGTGLNGSAAANGSLLIGNGSGYSLATLTQSTGITITNGAGTISIASTLGVAIDGTEITDDTIKEVDLNITNAPAGLDGYLLSFAEGTGNFTWVSPGAVGAGDITDVVAGAGLTGGATSGSATLDIGAGSGISVNANDIALGPLTADWNQTGAFNISLNNVGAGLKILENGATPTLFGIFDVADLSTGDKTYTFPNATGTVITSGNLTDITATGTITSGVWNGTAVGAQWGGTGVNGSAAANGSLLIGNGSGYVLATLTDGTGITISEGAGTITIASTLGTSIEGSEITDGTIEEPDLEVTNSPTNAFILSYDSATGGFTWIDNTGGTGSSKWTDSGTITYLTNTTDDLAIGGSTSTASRFFFDVTTGNQIILEGTGVDDTFETTLIFTNPTADRTLTFPNLTGTVVLTGQTLFTAAGTSGSGQAIAFGDTLTIAAGAGITTTGGATDTVTIASTLGTSVDLASEVTGTLPVGNGGTGATTFAVNGVLYGNTASALQVTAAGTSAQFLVANVSGVPTFVTMSSDATLSNAGALTISADAVALTTDTTGNYVATGASGNGVALTGGGSEGATLTAALGVLTTDWNQTGAFNISLNNVGAGLKMLENGATPTFFGIFDVADLTTADKTYTFPNETGTVCTTGSICSGYQAYGSYANVALSNLSGVAINTDLIGAVAGGMGIRGGSAANDDLILEGTTNATRTTSYVILQPNGGNVGIGTTIPSVDAQLDVVSAGASSIRIKGNTSGGSVYSAALVTAESNINVRARGLFLPTTDADANNSWFAGVPYNSGGFQIGNSTVHVTNDSNGPYISDNAKLFITTTGNVGIGTTSPTNILSLGNTAAQKFWIENTATDVVGRALTIAAGGTIAGTSVSDVVGGNLILQSGLGTGTGASTISFQTGTTLGTGTTLQTMSTKMTILGNGNVGIGDTSPASLLTVGNGDLFNVNTTGDVTSNFSTLDGSTTANGAGTASTTLILTSATNFNVGNYVLVNSTYAKITNIATNTLTISPALTWANLDAVTESHIPEIGATDLASTLTNRYGRGYFIDGIVTGNASTYYTDSAIAQTTGTTFNLLNTGTTNLNFAGATTALSIAAGTGTTTINNALTVSGGISSAGTITSGTWNGTTIGVAYGGINITSYAVGDLLYASGATTLAKLADVATGSCLISGGVGVAPSWGSCGGGSGANTALSNLASVAINTDLIGAVTGGMGIRGGSAANDDLILEGTTNATRTTSYVILQPTAGYVGIGTATPGVPLDVAGGNIRTTNQLVSTIATGTAPLAVTSTTKVANLNADLLDGFDSSAFGDATAANQTTILSRIGTNTDTATVPGGSNPSSLFAGIKGLLGRRFKMQTFTSGGTWTRPAGVDAVYVTMVGGGGGGGGASGAGSSGGGGGGKAYTRYPVAVSADVSVTVGAGGAGNTGSGSGTAGGSSIFSTLTATGGGGGNCCPGGGGNAGGVLTGSGTSNSISDIFGSTGANGGGGSGGETGATAGGAAAGGAGGLQSCGGGGGSTTFGRGGAGGACNSNGTSASANTGAGGGGGGGNSTFGDGGSGGSGIVIVEWFE